MKTIACSISFVLFVLTPLLAEEEAPSTRFDRFGQAYQFVFFSVLEGLYKEGATQDDVQRVLMKRSEEHGYEHFIYGCPICTSVLLAFELYRERPLFWMYKPIRQPDYQKEHATFGTGFSEEVQHGLNSDKVVIRLETLHHLVSKWIDDRMSAMNLLKEQRETLQKQIEEGRKQGMKTLAQHKKDPASMKRYAPGYAAFEGCALCNAACRIDFDRILEQGGAEQGAAASPD